MDNMELIAEVEKLNRSNRRERWVDLTLGIFIFILTIYLIEIKYEDHYDGFFKFLLDIKPHHLLSALGGTSIGLAWRNWDGNKELKLLNKLIQDK